MGIPEIEDKELARLVESAVLSEKNYREAGKELDRRLKSLGREGVSIKEFITGIDNWEAASVRLNRIGEIYAMRDSSRLRI